VFPEWMYTVFLTDIQYHTNKDDKTTHVPCVPHPHSYLDDTPLPSDDKPEHNIH